MTEHCEHCVITNCNGSCIGLMKSVSKHCVHGVLKSEQKLVKA